MTRLRALALAVLCLGAARPAPVPSPPEVTRGMAEPAIHYESAGRGGPWVILIHGGQLDSRMWDEQFLPLAEKGYRVVRYDVRGYGRSAVPVSPFSHGGDLLALMDQLQIDKAALVGLSLGGRIAIDFTLEHPGRVLGLVLAGPGLSGFKFSGDDAYEAIYEAALDGQMEKASDLWLKNPYMTPAMENPALAARLREISLDNAHNWLDNPLLERPLRPPALGRLSEIHKPALILVGDRDVPDIQKIVKKLETGIAGARKAVIKGAGHLTSMEKPAEFNRLVLEFLPKLKG